MAIDTGDLVPDLDLALSSGQTRRLSSYRGRWLVLYFYPKDSTPGCTTEGLDFNSLLGDFDAANATIVGVSRDSLKSHQNFCAKQGFKFDLASDADESVCKAFDVIKPKKLYGRDYVGIERSTFLIGPDGRVAQAWRPVKVPGHAAAVLSTLRELQSA
ncbi:peroxiredoxin Q/BCP [Lysobacter sp. HA35]